MNQRCFLVALMTFVGINSMLAQSDANEGFLDRMGNEVILNTEVSATASSGKFAPLWISANTQGLVSPYANSAYQRVGVKRSLTADSARQWRIGYGLDVTLNQNAQYNLFIHQAYVEAQYKKALLTIGQRERTIDFRNNNLTSGGLSQGINAQPIPMIRINVDYFHLTKWWQIKLRGAFGMTTDGAWQERWIGDKTQMRYTSNVLYHEKSIYWKFGVEEKLPLTFEIGIQMQNQFGGTTYNALKTRGQEADVLHNSESFNAFWHALVPIGGHDANDGTVHNTEGNVLGSYNAAITYTSPEGWQVRGYWEHFFEDHSQLTTQYGMLDHLLGVDVTFKKNPFVSHALVEHLSMVDQSGPVYHDPTNTMPDKLAGIDSYYNHALYSGWQNYGMGIGSPLLLSPIYNSNHELTFVSNRTQAWHVGIDGNPTDELSWKALFTWTKDKGTYFVPFDDPVYQRHYLVELGYKPRKLSGYCAKLSAGLSHGKLIGNTTGVQLTIKKAFRL